MSSQQLVLFILACIAPSLLLSLVGTAVVRIWALRTGFVDRPNVARKVHTTPTPLGGGIGIWLGLVGTFAAGQLALYLVQVSPGLAEKLPSFAIPHLGGIAQQSVKLWWLLGLASFLMVMGLVDDRRGLPWQIRLAMQFGVAAIAIWEVPSLRLTAFLSLSGVTMVLTLLWIVALINSFNMLDNMDGLSGGVAVISCAMLAVVLLVAPDAENRGPQLFVAGFLLVLVGAILGFLWHNRPPAKIFMGDAGAYLIGFCIAAATLLATYTSYKSDTRHAVLAPLLVMAVPLYDMATVILIRLRAGKSPFAADKNHFSHRLVDLGMSKVQAVLTVYLTTATCGLGALLLHRVDRIGAAIVLLLVLLVLSLIAILEAAARRKSRELAAASSSDSSAGSK